VRQSFELLILGSSSASPTSNRNASAQLLNIAERFFLIDCGEATQIQLRRYKAKFQSIDHIFISHLHGDHFFGLPGLLSSMHLLGRQQTLSIYAPPGLKELMDKLNKLSETKLNFPIQWHETSSGTSKMLFEDEKVEVYSFPLQHRIHCTGFLFREKKHPRKIDKYKLEKNKVSHADIQLLRHGMDVVNANGELIKNSEVTIDPLPARSFAYCSDTRYNEEVCSYIQGVDLLYHESTFLDDQAPRAAKTFHSTAKQAADIALKAGAKLLLLGHFSARYRVLDDFLKEASEIYPNCVLASDGKLIKI
jgi:ribonuclease Z